MEFVIIILGLLLGSFLNVLIYRLPRSQSIVRPRSRCPHCEHPLGIKDLIPLFSFILSRGKCRYCHKRISWRYPLVEAATAAGLWGLFSVMGMGWHFVSLGLLYLILLPAAIIDWHHFLLPDELTLGGLAIGTLLAVLGDHLTLSQALLGALTGGGLLFILAIFYPQGMGGGDVKLMAMVGSFLGWPHALGGIFLGAVVGILFFIAAYLLGRANRKTQLPFGTFLVFGTFVSFFYGTDLLDYYFKLIGFY